MIGIARSVRFQGIVPRLRECINRVTALSFLQSARAASSSSSSTSVPRGAISVEPVKSGPRAATPKPAVSASSDDSCGTAPAADDDLTDMVPMIDPASGTSKV